MCIYLGNTQKYILKYKLKLILVTESKPRPSQNYE